MTISPHDQVRISADALERARRHNQEPKSDIYRSARPLVIYILGGLGGSALAIAGWAHTQIWSHETTLQKHGEWQRMHAEQSAKDENRIEDRLSKIEMKIDRILEWRLGK